MGSLRAVSRACSLCTDRSASASEQRTHSEPAFRPSTAAQRLHRDGGASASFVFIWERSQRAVMKNAKAGGFRAETAGEASQEGEMKGKSGEGHTAGPSSPWGQRPGRHPRSRLHLLLSLSSSLSSPLGGASSSSASPALIGWSPGTHRWAWPHLRLLSKDLEKQVANERTNASTLNINQVNGWMGNALWAGVLPAR